jgi:hypothetical protein
MPSPTKARVEMFVRRAVFVLVDVLVAVPVDVEVAVEVLVEVSVEVSVEVFVSVPDVSQLTGGKLALSLRLILKLTEVVSPRSVSGLTVPRPSRPLVVTFKVLPLMVESCKSSII